MVQQTNPSKTNELNLDEFLRMVDVATTVRNKQEEVSQQLDIREVREELKKRLLKTAEVTGEQLTDFQIETAVSNYFQGLYSFQEPERDFGTKFAEIYVERKRLARKFGLPPLVAGIAAGAIWLTASGIHSASLRSQEREVEKAVETAYQERQKLLIKTQEISSSPFVDKLPAAESDKVKSQLSNAQERLSSMTPFFQKYCSDGTAEDDITRENYPEAKNNLASLEESFSTTRTLVQEGKVIIQTQEGLILTHRSLDTLIGVIRGLKPLEAFSQRAEGAYATGVGEIERRNLEGARKKEQELAGVKKDISQFSNFTSQTETLYKNIRAIAKEEEASQKGEALYKEAKQYVSSADVQRLSQAVSRLQTLDSTLNQEYVVRIVSRGGVKSGIDRYYTDARGKRVSGYYIIVEAADSRENVIPMDIRNEEDGKTERVQMWGERVPEEVYERVKEDKLDNGIINNNVVGKKERGYLREKITMQGVSKEGQITGW